MTFVLGEGIQKPGNGGLQSAIALATSYTLHTPGTNRSFRVVKIQWRNGTGGGGFLQVGTGATGAFVQVLPDISLINNSSDSMEEAEIADNIFAAALTFQVTPAGVGAAPANVQVFVTVEEYGG